MELRFKDKGTIFNVVITIMAAVFSVVMMIYGVLHLGLKETWPELVLTVFYIACLVMMWMYFFSDWCTLNVGVTVLLRDVLFAPPLINYPLHLVCLTLSVTLLLMLTYFYARKDWKTYSKRNLWAIFVIDLIIATLYNIDIFLEPFSEYSSYLMIEIWIRPTITYGLVACFVTQTKEK